MALHARARTYSSARPASIPTQIPQALPAGLHHHRLRSAAQQGDGRRNAFAHESRHPPGRRAEARATPTRSCAATRWAPTIQRDRARQAPGRHAGAALWNSATRSRARTLNQAFKRFMETGGQEEAGHGDGPRGARHRRAARTRAPTRSSGSTSRPVLAARRTRRWRSSPAGETVRGDFTGDGPIDAIFRAINAATSREVKLRDFRIDAITSGQDALGEASAVLELSARTRPARARRTIIEAAALAQAIRALSNVERKVVIMAAESAGDRRAGADSDVARELPVRRPARR